MCTGQCRIENTPKGWFISLIKEEDKIERERRLKRERAEKGEEERKWVSCWTCSPWGVNSLGAMMAWATPAVASFKAEQCCVFQFHASLSCTCSSMRFHTLVAAALDSAGSQSGPTSTCCLCCRCPG